MQPITHITVFPNKGHNVVNKATKPALRDIGISGFV
jgi:hypothetical protein